MPHKLKTSLSFLATDIGQLPPPGKYGNTAVEAVIFNKSGLESGSWKQVWQNVKIASDLYGNGDVTFHFPMNECDYVDDPWIHQRLVEAYKRACDLGLAGVVVHSNRIKLCKEWKTSDIHTEQEKIFTLLDQVAYTGHGNGTWLGLENMPLVGNYEYETDPLFTYSDDFTSLPKSVGVVWDFCHATSSWLYTTKGLNKELDEALFVRELRPFQLSIEPIMDRVVHWHFSSFVGINNPVLKTQCTEGVLPTNGELDERVYIDALRQTQLLDSRDVIINFEVQESDYYQRVNGPQIIEWANNLID